MVVIVKMQHGNAFSFCVLCFLWSFIVMYLSRSATVHQRKEQLMESDFNSFDSIRLEGAEFGLFAFCYTPSQLTMQAIPLVCSIR